MDLAHLIRHTRRPLLAVAFVLPVLAGGSPAESAALDRPETLARPASADTCWPAITPEGALPPVLPAWCGALTSGPPTFRQGDNFWVDNFNHGLHMADLGAGYRTFNSGSVNQVEYFRHNEHWMVDINGTSQDGSTWNVGGTTMRPDRSFRFQDGKLVVEADVAAGVSEYRGAAWPELIVTTAPAPTFTRRDGVYSYDTFAGAWTLGCRLQSDRQPTCALFDDSDRGAGDGGRVWEISAFQQGGFAAMSGGFPADGDQSPWRVCEGTDPDTQCRDRFRWEITADSLTLSVNGVQYMQHTGASDTSRLPDALINGDVYVYFSSWIHQPDADTVRFHWNHVRVNPDLAPPSDPLALLAVRLCRL